jgi:hypothetical protein
MLKNHIKIRVVASQATFSSVEASMLTVLSNSEAGMTKQHNHATGAEDEPEMREAEKIIPQTDKRKT